MTTPKETQAITEAEAEETKLQEQLVSNVRNSQFFQAILKHIVEEAASSVSFEEFKDIIQTPMKESILKKLYNIQKEKFVEEISDDIDDTYNKFEIGKKYNEITQLMNEATREKGKLAWRPKAGDCTSQLKPQRIRILLEKRKRLEEMLNKKRYNGMVTRMLLDRKRITIKSLVEQIAKADITLQQISNRCVQKEKRI